MILAFVQPAPADDVAQLAVRVLVLVVDVAAQLAVRVVALVVDVVAQLAVRVVVLLLVADVRLAAHVVALAPDVDARLAVGAGGLLVADAAALHVAARLAVARLVAVWLVPHVVLPLELRDWTPPRQRSIDYANPKFPLDRPYTIVGKLAIN